MDPLELIKDQTDVSEEEAHRPGPESEPEPEPEESVDEEQCKIKREMDVQYLFPHTHPLLLIEHQGEEDLCFVCEKAVKGQIYYCSSFRFYLHKTCVGLVLPPEIHHHSHPLHPLLLVQESPYKGNRCRCDLCDRNVNGFVYHCATCSFDLDITCASLALEINHPFHPSHPLVYLPESPDPQGYYVCNFCHRPCWEPLYHCASCNFSLDIDCASRHLSTPADLPEHVHFSHEHKMMFIEEHDDNIPAFCFGCDERLSGPTYRCLQCNNFDLHKQCADSESQIVDHFLHRHHTVTMLVDPPIHPETCTCEVCERHYQGFVYHCSYCNFTRPFKDFFRQTMVETRAHQHPLMLLQRRIPFICDYCGVSGDRDPCICGSCQILLHESCISVPRIIKSIWHPHTLYHKISLPVDKYNLLECLICHEEIDPQYGSYSCSKCLNVFHVNCCLGTSTNIRDGDEPIGYDQFNVEESPEEKKHVYHEHILVLTDNGEVKGDNVCDGCMKPVSKSFYSCEPCGFFLHKDCAELPTQNQFPIHKHLLTLTKNVFTCCDACRHYHHGFSYKCDRRRCNFKIDLHCSLLSPTLHHPSHDHKLFLDKNYVGNCSSCDNHISRALQNGAYRCEPCGYVLDFKCIRLPHTAWYKYDKHDLTLIYQDHSDPSQRFCDICEEERQPNSLFYYCEQCDNSVHIGCIVGDIPFVKLGSTFRHESHPHSLTFVKKIWNCPPCNVCRKICHTQALECEEPECNFIVHWNCLGQQEKQGCLGEAST